MRARDAGARCRLRLLLRDQRRAGEGEDRRKYDRWMSSSSFNLPRVMYLILFDIDGTLVLTGRAGMAGDESRLPGILVQVDDADGPASSLPAGPTGASCRHHGELRTRAGCRDAGRPARPLRAASRRRNSASRDGRQGRDAGHPRAARRAEGSRGRRRSRCSPETSSKARGSSSSTSISGSISRAARSVVTPRAATTWCPSR